MKPQLGLIKGAKMNSENVTKANENNVINVVYEDYYVAFLDVLWSAVAKLEVW